MEAFAATLEELNDADLLLHVVDATSPRMEEQIQTVEGILSRLNLHRIRTLLVLNKTDLLTRDQTQALVKRMGGIPISAIDPPSVVSLTNAVESIMWPCSSNVARSSISRPW
jgi:GTP-binding protein HflX